MKKSILFSAFALFFSLNSFALTKNVSVECALNENSELSATVTAGHSVTVFAPNFVNGYEWISADGIEGKIIRPAELGGTYETVFVIRTSEQFESSKTYVFKSARSFDSSAPTWTCSVTVNKR